MDPEPGFSRPCPQPGEIIVRLSARSGQADVLSGGEAQSMMSFSAFAVEVESAPVVRTLVLDLIDRRRWFAVISLPGDVWVVGVKSADQDVFEAILKLRQIQWHEPRPELMKFGG